MQSIQIFVKDLKKKKLAENKQMLKPNKGKQFKK